MAHYTQVLRTWIESLLFSLACAGAWEVRRRTNFVGERGLVGRSVVGAPRTQAARSESHGVTVAVVSRTQAARDDRGKKKESSHVLRYNEKIRKKIIYIQLRVKYSMRLQYIDLIIKSKNKIKIYPMRI